MVVNEVSPPKNIREPGAEEINQIWRNVKLKEARMKRAKLLVVEPSVGNQEDQVAERWKTKKSITGVWKN